MKYINIVIVFLSLIACVLAFGTFRSQFDCAYHSVIKIDTGSKKVTVDSYGMLAQTGEEKSHFWYHFIEDDYVVLRRCDIKETSSSQCYTKSNMSGQCSENPDLPFLSDLQLFRYFTYDDKPQDVPCPNGNSRNCKKYCSTSDGCIIVDSEEQLLQREVSGNTLTFTWFDDAPSLEFFSGTRCDGTKLIDPVKVCNDVVDVNINCAFHFVVNMSLDNQLVVSDVDYYGMMKGRYPYYFLTSDLLARCDIDHEMVGGESICFYVDNRTDKCDNRTGSYSWFRSRIVYDQQQSVFCPEGKGINCVKYTLDFDHSWILNEKGQLVKENDKNLEINYTWLDDAPAIDMFAGFYCDGTEMQEPVDVCNLPSSSVFVPPASSSAFVTKAAGIIVFVFLVLAIF